MLTARTLSEAQIYFALMRITGTELPLENPQPTLAGTTRVEGEQEWLLSYDLGPDEQIQVAVPYGSEAAARQLGALFGLGLSQLVDPGQWLMVATTCARRALDGDIALMHGQPVPPRQIELDWEYAAAAVGEAMKFLPNGAGAVPPDAFWSELGTRAYADSPELFTRERLQDDYNYYQGTLDGFRRLHRPSDSES